jgi:hypothetical protein
LTCPVEEKIERNGFRSLEEFKEPFQIIHQNCMTKGALVLYEINKHQAAVLQSWVRN